MLRIQHQQPKHGASFHGFFVFELLVSRFVWLNKHSGACGGAAGMKRKIWKAFESIWKDLEHY